MGNLSGLGRTGAKPESQGWGGIGGLDFGGIQPHALGSKCCTIKGNLRLPDVTLSSVEDNAMVFGSLHQAQEVSVMLLRSVTEEMCIIVNGDSSM